jgi:glycosyltransferase involved in cell wall biosynthesis
MQPDSLAIIEKVREYRAETGHQVYFTLDAGPNVHLLYPGEIVHEVRKFIEDALADHCENGSVQQDWVGEGPEEPQLRRLTRELDLVKHVTYAHLNVPHERLLEDAAVYVQTPREQGFGAAVLEAMAWGLPVVATSVGGLIPLVREGVTGYLIKPGDHEGLAERILEILQDDATRLKFGENARLWVGERFSYRQMIEHTAAAYATVLGEHEIQKQTGSLQKA